MQLVRPTMVELATELGVTCAAFTATDGVATLTDQVWDVRSTVQPLRAGLWAPIQAPFGAVFAAWAGGRRESPPGRQAPTRRAHRVVASRSATVATWSSCAPRPASCRRRAAWWRRIVPGRDFLAQASTPRSSYAVSTIEAPVLRR